MAEIIITFVLVLAGAVIVLLGLSMIWDGIERLYAYWREDRWRRPKRR